MPDYSFIIARALSVSLAVFLLIFPLGCTQQERARQLGGTATIDLPKGQKLVSVSWKGEDDLWYLTRPMRDEEQPETHEYIESHSWGYKSGKVIFKESR